MLHRVGISVDEKDWEHIRNLQKRFKISNRSEFFRELVRRYEKLESDFGKLQSCLGGYINHPESESETRSIVKSSLREQCHEDWR